MTQAAASSQVVVELLEDHRYTITLDHLSDIAWQNSSWLTARMALPYAALEALNQKQSSASWCARLSVKLSEREDASAMEIEVPRRKIGLGKRLLAKSRWPLEQPGNTLASVDGVVRDGIADEQNDKSVFRRAEGRVFSSDLLLVLSIWVPNLKAQSDQEPSRQLSWLLAQRANSKIIALKQPRESELAKTLIRLASSGGGLVLVGVADDDRRAVVGLGDGGQHGFEELLMRALLSTWPVVPIGRPDYLPNSDGKDVAVIRVPTAIRGVAYEYVDNDVLTTIGRPFIQRVTRATGVADAGATAIPFSGLSAEEQARAIFIDWDNIDDLGKAIAGIVNAQERNGLILLRNLPGRSRNRLGLRSATQLQQVEEKLIRTTQQCRPRVDVPEVQLGEYDGHPAALIRVNGQQHAAAIYRGHGYIARENRVDPLPLAELFDNFLRRQGAGSSAGAGLGPVQVEYAALSADKQPLSDGSLPPFYPVYDMQKKAMRWLSLPAMGLNNTEGYECKLLAPIDQALTMASEQERLKGRVVVTFDGVLASDAEVRVEDADGVDITQTCEIRRKTRITLDIEANLLQLFKRRVSASTLVLRFTDVALSRDVVDCIMQACADVGFRVGQYSRNTGGDLIQFSGIRNDAYNDVQLDILLESQRSALRREVRFARRTDSKETETSTLTIYVALRGNGEDAAVEISKRHSELSHVITDRLAYQRFE